MFKFNIEETRCMKLRTCLPWLLGACQAAFAAPLVAPATEGRLGLDAAADYRIVDGNCRDCATSPTALWYFRDDLVAVPQTSAAAFERGSRPQDDVRRWAASRAGKPEGSHPALVWIGSPQVARGTLSTDGGSLVQGGALPFSVVPKIESNLSYYNPDSVRHFAGRSLKARGRLENGRFIARTLWPEDYALGAHVEPAQAEAGTLDAMVRADGAAATLASRVLWTRDGKPASLAGRPVMAFVLNGAQGDDDEAHGGHFAIATGRFGPRGEWDDWLVNNFYNLDSFSEKGIIASTLPMDAYQADLNSGQSWYRPSYMLVAVFKSDRVPALYQEAIGRVFNHFYRHDFRYNHASANCAGISLETLRSLGWNIPLEGPGGRLKAIAALPYMAIKDGNLESGRKAYDYLAAEKTDLYPFVAFSAAGEDLRDRIAKGGAGSGFEKAMAEDIEALVYVRIPQFPSSRAMGQAPVASLDEYMARTPADRAQWKIIPVPPRPFPPELKDPAAPREEARASSFALAGYAGFLGVMGVGGWRLNGRRRARGPRAFNGDANQ
ncbi:MAG TPA: hypothetical protein VF816_01565 [Rhodocyclaceae bacterium]